MDDPTASENLASLRTVFSPLLGQRLHGVSSGFAVFDPAEGWEPFEDLPIRLDFGLGEVVGVCWSNCDTLWLGVGDQVPFDTGEGPIEWRPLRLGAQQNTISETLVGVSLAKNDFRSGDLMFGRWTRILFRFATSTLEVFNAGDENGWTAHSTHPSGIEEVAI